MNFKSLQFFLFVICFTFVCYANESVADNAFISMKTVQLYDKARSRKIPIEIYNQNDLSNKISTESRKQPLAIINHGYGVKNTEYSFIAKNLATQGYYVVSIQHDLKTDPALALTGSIYDQRKPMWERGVANILFVMNEMKVKQPSLNLNKVLLIGHSNGGDISMLFATNHPELVSQVISLDNLRMPFPRSGLVPILSFRANDTKADQNVLPTFDEQKKLHIKLIPLKDSRHIDMCDRGPEAVRNEINNQIINYLKTKE